MGELKFVNGIVQDYTIILSTRDYRHLGQLTKVKNVNSAGHLNSASEFSFSIYKYDLLKAPENSIIPYKTHIKLMNALWEQIVDFKLIFVKELNEYFEIKVSIEDGAETIKTITATSLCECELSQLNLNNLEINSESDILRDDYEVTTLYNSSNPNASLLHRALADKAPHYTIMHVDDSISNIQRTFSGISSSIYDFFTGEVAEQFNCLFKFDSTCRGIYVYDLYTVCKDCGHRKDFYDKCPECGSTNLKYFGKDTTIFVDKTNLTDSINLEVNADNAKNCFKLVAGDELMTATVRMLNQNGSDYIYRVSDYQRNDMPKELVQKLDEYDELYNSYTEEYEDLMQVLYEATDEILYLESGMMPTIEQAEVTAQTEASKLESADISPLGLTKITTATSLSTVNSALKNYAKIFVKTGYVKLEIADDAIFKVATTTDENGKTVVATDSNGYHYGTWTGKFVVTNYSDEEDVVTTKSITITVHDNYKDFAEQKVLKSLASEVDEDGSVFDVLAIESLDKFKEALTYYGYNRLVSYRDAIDGALGVLQSMNIGSETSASENQEATDEILQLQALYEELYEPYYEKLKACEAEMEVRQAEIDKAQAKYDETQARINEIQNDLDLETYLGDYFLTFCAYRREDTYENSNYISDGLTNVELIERAKEFLEVARQELIKASEPEYTLSSTLYNLLAMKEFKPIVNNFELGNWIRVKVDGVLYRLRLIGYDLSFDNLQTLGVEFSNVTKIRDIVHETQQIIQSAQSIATSYGYVSKQAEKGKAAQNVLNEWQQVGLNSGLVQISNNVNEEVTYGKYGILCRSWDDITETYDDKQLKLTHNCIVFTSDGWKTIRQILGEHSYITYDEELGDWVTKSGYGMTSDFVQGGHVGGSIIVGGKIYSNNYSNIAGKLTGSFMNLEDGTFSFAGGNLVFDGTNLIISEKTIGESVSNIDVTAENLHIKAENITGTIGIDNIGGVYAARISGTIASSQVEQGTIKAGSVDAEDINGKITSSQIESVNTSKLTGTISSSQIESLAASKLTGTVASSKIAETLDNKILTNATLDEFTVTDNDVSYSGITGTYIIGENTLQYVNGILVAFS